MIGIDPNVQKLRPTLLIGVGGTGYKIIVRAKARFQETYPENVLKLVRFIVFDTDPNNAPVRDSVGNIVQLEPGKELIHTGGVPVDSILSNLRNYPEIATEIPSIQRLPRMALIQGAKQVRPLGRLAFFFHFRRVSKAIETALRGILNISHHSDGAAAVQSINVFFVASACGGTGSGSILDLAYLTRYLAHTSLGLPKDQIFNNGLLILPEAFKVPVASEGLIRANASAMLAELDHFTNYQDFDVTYSKSVHIRDKRPPFNITYLVDATNENGLTIEDLNQLAPIMAEAIFLQTGSYLGSQTASVFDNIPTAMSGDQHGYLRAYSMLGTSSLHFNAVRMRHACAHRLAHRIITDVLLKNSPDNQATHYDDDTNNLINKIKSEVQGYLSTTKLTLDLLRLELKKMPAGQTMSLDFNTERLDQYSKDQIVRRVEAAAERYERETLQDTYLAQVEENRKKLAKTCSNLLADYVYDLCDNQELGIPAAQQFLIELDHALAPLRDALKEERDQANQQATRIQQRVNRDRDNFDEITQRFDLLYLLRIRFRVNNARRRYTEARRRYQTYFLEQGVATQGLLVIEDIERQRRHLIGALANLRAALEHAGNQAERKLATIQNNWSSNYVTEKNLETVDNIPVYYDRYLNQSVSNEALKLFNARPISSWLQEFEIKSNQPAEEIAKYLSEYTYKRFLSIVEDETIDQQIPNKHSDPTEMLQNLIKLGAPFSNYDPTTSGQGSEDLNTTLVIGVYDSNKSIYRNTPINQATLISTFDPHRISILHTKHGLSLYSLRQYSIYKTHFANYQKNSPLHCFNVVEQETKAHALFVRAEAFGQIETRGAIGFVALTMPESKLGEDLPAALRYVVSNQDQIQADLEQMVEEWLRDHTYQDVIYALYDYIKQEERSPRLLHQELCTLAKSEMDRYKHLGGVS